MTVESCAMDARVDLGGSQELTFDFYMDASVHKC